MNKEELHKAAEEYMKSRKSWPQSHSVTVWHPEIERVVCIPVSEIMADFHIHQTKKMLEAWTDEKIMDEYWEDAFGIMHFRDLLLKQLEG